MIDTTPRPDDTRDADEDLSFLDRWILPYVEDSALWPVLIVIIVHLIAFVAPILAFAWQERTPKTLVGIAAVVLLSAWTIRYEYQERSKLGALTVIVGVTWLSSIAAAIGAIKTGLF